jgi:hypothetical protein
LGIFVGLDDGIIERWATGANAAVALSIIPIAYIFLKERPAAKGLGIEAFHNVGRQLATIVREIIL